MTIKELLEQRAKHLADARGIYETADTEKREVTPEEVERYDKHMGEIDRIKKDVDRRDALAKAEARMAETREVAKIQRADKPDERATDTKPESRTIKLRKSRMGGSRDVVIPDSALADRQQTAFRTMLAWGENAPQSRNLQKDIDIKGGFLSAPVQFQAELIQELDDALSMRQISNVLPPLTTADSLGVPSLDTDIGDPTWTTELQTGAVDTAMEFGAREITPHPLARVAKISKVLIRRSEIDPEALVRERLAFKFAAVQENAFMNGDGNQKPLGVFTASAAGISTGRDVSSGNTDSAITFDGLTNAYYSLKAQYRRGGAGNAWIFHRDALRELRKIKDGDGQYVWERSVRAGEPDTILNVPVLESEFAPNTFTTGLYVGILGDFSFYWIVDALTLQIQVLIEKYALTNENGFIGRLEADGMPVLETPFARVKLA